MITKILTIEQMKFAITLAFERGIARFPRMFFGKLEIPRFSVSVHMMPIQNS